MDNAGQLRQAGRVSQEMDKRRKIQAALRDAVNSLEQRLHPILGPPPPASAADPRANGTQSDNHATNLSEDNEALTAIVSSLAIIKERVEL